MSAPLLRPLARAQLALALASLSVACQTTLSVGELDALNRSVGAKTVLVRDEYTIYSPFEVQHTESWIEVLDREFALVGSFFGAAADRPIAVLLDLIEVEEGTVPAERVSVQDLVLPEGLLGWAQRDSVVIRVSPVWRIVFRDGREVPGVFLAETYAETVRHELAHAFAKRLGLEGARWFDEGLAEFVEGMRATGSGLELAAPSDELRRVAALPLAERRLADVLDWEAEDPDRADQPPWRPLAHAFVRFLLRSAGSDTFVARLEELSRRSRSELLALEAGWQAWLEGIAHVR